MADYYAKTNDTAIDFQAILQDSAGDPIPLSGATVRFHVKSPRTNALLVDGAAEVLDADDALVKYAGDNWSMSATGIFWVEWEITFSNSKILTCPNNGHQTLQVTGELG